MTEINTLLTVAVIALVTAAIRFFPFMVWNKKRKAPEIIEKLGKILPYAVMGMLVVYCLKDVSFTEAAGFVPELIACIVVIGSYILKRNTLISIVAGTVCYMLLVQFVF
ncbi:MAG: branched-chain amino acid transporter permease [Oscillospiraceae bacterium]